MRQWADTIMKCVYHAWAAILGGEDAEWITWPAKILRIGFLFFILISVSTYTANLAAFFTTPSFILHGPKNMKELKESTACTLMENEDFVLPWVKNFVSTGQNYMFPGFDLDLDVVIPVCTGKLRSGE